MKLLFYQQPKLIFLAHSANGLTFTGINPGITSN